MSSKTLGRCLPQVVLVSFALCLSACTTNPSNSPSVTENSDSSGQGLVPAYVPPPNPGD